jgi:hypothetical protein
MLLSGGIIMYADTSSTTDGIMYKKLNIYKYKLQNRVKTLINIKPQALIHEPQKLPYIELTKEGLLTIVQGYAWDGPSGLTIDTRTFMRGSLIHDALYQLMRAERIDRKKCRKEADKILVQICREDGMSAFRCFYVYWAVRLFAGKASKLESSKYSKTFVAP